MKEEEEEEEEDYEEKDHKVEEGCRLCYEVMRNDERCTGRRWRRIEWRCVGVEECWRMW